MNQISTFVRQTFSILAQTKFAFKEHKINRVKINKWPLLYVQVSCENFNFNFLFSSSLLNSHCPTFWIYQHQFIHFLHCLRSFPQEIFQSKFIFPNSKIAVCNFIRHKHSHYKHSNKYIIFRTEFLKLPDGFIDEQKKVLRKWEYWYCSEVWGMFASNCAPATNCSEWAIDEPVSWPVIYSFNDIVHLIKPTAKECVCVCVCQ